MSPRKQGLTASLIARGFDLSHPIPFERGAVVACSQCAALAINGVPCHERGCPNETRECAACEQPVREREAYRVRHTKGTDYYCNVHCAEMCAGCEDCDLPDDIDADADQEEE